jgi:glycosyltransferase involved in cell wall biosynthesis
MMSGNRKRILICIDWYEPGYKAGGPIRSVANLVSALKHEYEFYVLTSIYDLGENQPYGGIEANEWHDRDGVFVKYMDRRALTMPSIKGNIREINPDLVYLNSMFSWLFTIVPLRLANRMGVKVVIAPRGMLGEASLRIKPHKKKVFIRLAKLLRLYSKVTWHASSPVEERDIINVFGKKSRVMIAQNLPAMTVHNTEAVLAQKNKDSIRFIFVGRIARIKNIDLAIRAIKQVKSSKQLRFDIFGFAEDESYLESFSKELRNHGNLTISYNGMLDASQVAAECAAANFMLMPTKHENYGHAIVEAWGNGCPVIISRFTPWKNLRDENLGWDVDITKEENLVSAIQQAVDLDFTSYLSMAAACQAFFAEKICDPKIVDANRKLFE